MIYTVVCTDINDYVNWQCELLEYSWSRINQPGKLIRLVACDADQELPKHRHAQVYRTRPTNVHPQSGDVYPCYNRLYSLHQWLDKEDIQGTILIVDCDVVFRSPITTEVSAGHPLGQDWLDYGISEEFRKAATRASPAVDIDALQKITWPALLDADDLRQLLPRWIEITVSIREQIRRQESDMFGFLVAAQEQQLEFEVGTTTAFMPWPDEQVSGAPLIHYCQSVENVVGEKIWSKGDYKPWQRVNRASTAALPYCIDLLNQVDEFARLKNTEPNHQSDTIFIAIASYCEPELIDTINSCLAKARLPQNLRFGICHQYDNSDTLTDENCLDRFSQDSRFRYVTYDHGESQGGCWARNIAQQLYKGETYTLQIDAHTQMIESWDSILIEMLKSMPSTKPLISQFPPLYFVDEQLPKESRLSFRHIDDLSKVKMGVAIEWSEHGYLLHNQEHKPEHNQYPRRTRFISGAFVFTTGEWNEVVMQDPKHFYTGEEFALAVRSYTHGYDLFDPSQIVAWHRYHPYANRKFWHDNSEEASSAKHQQGVAQLNLLLDGDPDSKLGRFGLGTERTLEDYAIYSGIDCINKTVSEDARQGVPPILDFDNTNAMTMQAELPSHNDELIDVTVYLENKQPLLLCCLETTPILMSLFQGLKRKSKFPDEVIYLNLGEDGAEQVYFKQSQLLSIETTPALSSNFFEQYLEQNSTELGALSNADPASQPQTFSGLQGGEFSDEWKVWIWKNVERGCSKDNIFKQLTDHGFPFDWIRAELNYQPSIPLDQIVTETETDAPYIANPVADRIDNDKLEIYSVDGFLNTPECEQLCALIVDNCQRSTVIDVSGALETPNRTSSSCFFDLSKAENALAAEVSTRIAKFIGIDPSYMEPIQAQFYKPGEEYKPHIDWIDPELPIYESQAGFAAGGQRTWSVLVYLNEVQAGGETNFSNADLIIEPDVGKMVYWNNAKTDGELNRDTLHQSCPVTEGEKMVLTLWFRSYGNGPMYHRPSNELIPRFTVDGIRKQKMPAALYKTLSEFYVVNTNTQQRNEFVEGGFLQNSADETPSTIVDIDDDLKELINRELLAICEEWSRKPLQLTSVYGVREYARGTSLLMHTDTCGTHIISVILNIAQTVDREWPLLVDDHMCRRHSVVLQAGEMLLYEGARLPHGRPEPFAGENFANVFVHYCPVDYTTEKYKTKAKFEAGI